MNEFTTTPDAVVDAVRAEYLARSTRLERDDEALIRSAVEDMARRASCYEGGTHVR
jgi:hypothetical protein